MHTYTDKQQTSTATKKTDVSKPSMQPHSFLPSLIRMPDTTRFPHENMSGHSYSDAVVYYNSSKPTQIHTPIDKQKEQANNVSVRQSQFEYETECPVQRKQEKANLSEIGIVESQTIQCLMDKFSMDEIQYRNTLRSTVLLYAELNGVPVGPDGGRFKTTRFLHAEENLITYLSAPSVPSGGSLVVYLSTSPCSSDFGTKKDDSEGCIEKLNKLKSKFSLSVKADHVYQPKELGEQERDLFGTGYTGMSSWGTVGAYSDFLEIDSTVAQLAQKHNLEGK